jgi:hypothetical protein
MGFERNCLVYLFWTNGKYSKKNLRGNWQEEDLQNAMRVVRTSRLSTNTAAIHYKIPRRTLRAYLAENKQCKSKLRRKTAISPQQENELSKRIIRLTQIGYPITLKILRMRVLTYCEKNNIPYTFVKEKGMAGRAWVEVLFASYSHD